MAPFATALLLGAMLLLAAALAASCSAGQAACPQCSRHECRNMTFMIRLRDGTSVRTCCPRCGLRYIQERRPDVADLSVMDFQTAEPLDAAGAFYVEGSDVSPCSTSSPNPPKDERGCCLSPVYDRCQPSLLAFRTRERAESFAREHGGLVRSFSMLPVRAG